MNATTELIGWKAIAGYFNIALSTVKDWPQRYGLPVYKVGGQVRADVDAIERWKKNRQRSSADSG